MFKSILSAITLGFQVFLAIKDFFKKSPQEKKEKIQKDEQENKEDFEKNGRPE